MDSELLDRIYDLLCEIEWSGGYDEYLGVSDRCPKCWSYMPNPHDQGCELKQLINILGEMK